MLRVEHVSKRFGPTTALRDVNLHLRKGEVLGLLGDNGAGKSTLIKILCGFHEAGLRVDVAARASRTRPKSVLDARHHGIDTVYQDLALVDELSRLSQPVPAPRGRASGRFRCSTTAR